MQMLVNMLFGNSDKILYQKISNVESKKITHFKFNIRIEHKINLNNIVTYEINNCWIPRNLFTLKLPEEYNPNETVENIIIYLKKYATSKLEKIRLEITNEDDLRKIYNIINAEQTSLTYNTKNMLIFIKNIPDSRLKNIQNCKYSQIKFEKLITSIKMFNNIMNSKILPDYPTYITCTVW